MSGRRNSLPATTRASHADISLATGYLGLFKSLLSRPFAHLVSKGKEERPIALLPKQWSDSELLAGFQSALKNSALFTLDVEGRIDSWTASATAVTGYQAAEVVGQPFSIFCRRQDVLRGRPAEALRTARLTGRFEEEGIRIRRDGSSFWASVVIAEACGSGWQAPGFTYALTDISEQVRMRGELARARQQDSTVNHTRQARLASAVLTHDLNNIFNALSLRVGLLHTDKLPVEQIDNVERIRGLLEDATLVVRNLRSHFDLGVSQQVSSFLLSEVIDKAIEQVRTRLCELHPDQSESVRLEVAIPSEARVLGTAADLDELFQNLIFAECDAMPGGGLVRIFARVENSHVVTSIEEHAKKNAWGRTNTPVAAAISPVELALVTRLGGSVNVVDAGGATVLTLSLPIESLSAPPTRQSAAGTEHPQPNVLLIDDDSENLDALRDGLESKGYAVRTAGSGYEGLDQLKHGPHFDYVICDVGMPGMSGWEVAEEIANLSPQTKIFMLTGWASEIVRSDPRRRLVVDVLSKPTDLNSIDAALARAA